MTYDEASALVVVDVQNDFADPGGSLYVKGGEAIIPLVNAEVDDAAAAGAFVVFTQDWHPPSTPHFEKDGGLWPVHCVRETWGAELHPDLSARGDKVKKGMGTEDGYSAFSEQDLATGGRDSTGLEDELRRRGIERVVVVGLATDYCVKATALDALARGFDVTVLKDCVRAVDLQAGDGQRSLEEIATAGGRIE